MKTHNSSGSSFAALFTAAFVMIGSLPAVFAAYTPLDETFGGTSLPATLLRGGDTADYGTFDASVGGTLSLTADGNWKTSYIRTFDTAFTWSSSYNNAEPISFQFRLASAFTGTGRVMLYLVGNTNDATLLNVADPANARQQVMGLVLTYDSVSGTYNVDFYQKSTMDKALTTGTKIASLSGIQTSTTTFGFTLDGTAETVTLFAGDTKTAPESVSGSAYVNRTVPYFQIMNVGSGNNTVVFDRVSVAAPTAVPEPAHVSLLIGSILCVLTVWHRRTVR
ncbi:MAG: cell wall anchor protein [Opitutaceae bacterium]|jgi:hypothetical protein|nr:cell wall anchor protein [Opitutaceae bacterium]